MGKILLILAVPLSFVMNTAVMAHTISDVTSTLFYNHEKVQSSTANLKTDLVSSNVSPTLIVLPTYTPLPTDTPTPIPTPTPLPTNMPMPLPTKTPLPDVNLCHIRGITAVCCDGSTSKSTNNRNICLHHDGVCSWC